ncbi:MAG: flagella assembly protein FlgT middle domain-containing protein [Pseudomonadota bacterium]
MLIRLRLLSFLMVSVFTTCVYAEDKQNLPGTSSPAPAKTTNAPDLAATPASSTAADSAEPKIFEPISLPKPVVTETLTASPTVKTPITEPCVEPVANKVITKAVPATTPTKSKKPVISKAIAPKTIAIKSDAVAHPAPIEKVATPAPATNAATEKANPEGEVKQQEIAETQIKEDLPEEVNTPTTISDSAKNTQGQQCANTTNRLQKSLLIMAFPRLTPTSSTAGDLYQAEHQLPQLLSDLLVSKRSSITPQQLNQAMPQASASTDAQLSLLSQRLASDHRSQFILSGEIVDMSMTTPDATYNPGLYTRVVNKFFDVIETKNRFDKRDRLFSFQLHLRDGFTGQELLTKRYDTYGIWGHAGKVGFGTPLFWKSDYGQQIKGLVNVAANELTQAINCQPFITQIDSRPGQTQIILQSGTNNGLHRGDIFSLYQLIIQGSDTRYQEHDVRLVNRNLAIELREVYASHSVGVINSTTYLSGKLVAVAQ